MIVRPSGPCHIIDWLNDCDDLYAPTDVPAARPTCKRKLSLMDEETPRQKRSRRTSLYTPSLTASGQHDAAIVATPPTCSSPTRSSTSSLTRSSKGSSPTKRQREHDIRYSKPVAQFLSRHEAFEWKNTREIAAIPALPELLSCIQNFQAHGHTTPIDLEDILLEVTRCKSRNANEETWSDDVVRPAINAARKASPYREAVDIINVKTIDVWPTQLLQMTQTSERTWKKRVDYSIGLEIAKRGEMSRILASTEDYTLTQSNHDLISDRALCSHLEIKGASDTETAKAQLKTWCTAGFRKQRRLAMQRASDPASQSSAIKLAPQPVWLWDQDKVQLWVAVIDFDEDTIYFLDEKTFLIDEHDVESLSKIISTMSRVMDWGYKHYLPWFRCLIGRQDLNIDVASLASDPG